MTHHFHAVVWIDHKAGTVGSGHAHEGKAYLTAVTDALKPNYEILIVGHGNAKTELAHFIRDHVPALAPRIMGVEAIDRQTEGEVIAFARKFFEAKDHTTPRR